LGLVLVIFAGLWTHSWHSLNGLMDGTQNEVFHVDNALNLWDATAWVGRDSTDIQHYLYAPPWPPFLYIFAWPFLAIWGASHEALVMSNLGHLTILLAAVYLLGSHLRDQKTGLMAMCLVMVYPSITGNLVRFEPNVALTAWVTFGAYALLRSRGFSDLRWSVLFAAVSACGLLVDRVAYAFFLVGPSVFVLVSGWRKSGHDPRLRNAGIALLVLCLGCGWWYWHFFQSGFSELFEQVGTGNIDSRGAHTELRSPLALETWLFYPAVLLDAQAGLIPGLLCLCGISAFLWKPTRNEHVLLWLVLSSVLIFTFIQKKQVYYTVPVLGAMAVLSAAWLRDLGRRGWWVFGITCILGVHQIALRTSGQGLPLPTFLSSGLGAPVVLPDAWVDRSYPQAKRPMGLSLPVDEILQALPIDEVLGQEPVNREIYLFSEDHVWTEDYAVLHFRERLPERIVWRLIGNPARALENFKSQAVALVQISHDEITGWPTAEQILQAQRMDKHPENAENMPLGELMQTSERHFREVKRFRWEGAQAVVWHSRILD